MNIPLYMYEYNFGPGDGCVKTFLHGETPKRWRLDRCYDTRIDPNPYWMYREWSNEAHGMASAEFSGLLKTDEILGFLKAKHPETNWRAEIYKKVREMLESALGPSPEPAGSSMCGFRRGSKELAEHENCDARNLGAP